MHIANITSASLDDQIEPIDLAQTPGDVVVLSFSNSDLSAVAQAYAITADMAGTEQPTMRLAALKDLRHPMSVDLWITSVAAHARVIVVRILGGYDWWSYGCDQLAQLARQRGIRLALLPGESHAHDARLAALSTCTAEQQDRLLSLFREGGPNNMRALLQVLAALAQEHGADNDTRAVTSGAVTADTAIDAVTAAPAPAPAVETLPRFGYYAPGKGVVGLEHFKPEAAATTGATTVAAPIHDTGSPDSGARAPKPIVPILFYRALLLAGETAPIDALCRALAQRGLCAVPVFVPTLKDKDTERFLIAMADDLAPAVLITTTAFAASLHAGGSSLFTAIGVPVLQAIVATTQRRAWQASERGLGTSDIAMNVVLPELDGRLAAGVLSFKDHTTPLPVCKGLGTGAGADTEKNKGKNTDQNTDAALPSAARPAAPPPGPLQYNALLNRPQPDRVNAVAARVANFIRLQQTPAAQRRIAIIMPDYPGADGRAGYAVGLDVPASVLAMLQDMQDSSYDVRDIPKTPRDLIAAVSSPKPALSPQDWRAAFGALPEAARNAVTAAWGPPPPLSGEHTDPAPLCFRYARFGNVTVALAPDRGQSSGRRESYHDPDLPPRPELLAFGSWLSGGRRQRPGDAPHEGRSNGGSGGLGCHAVVHCGAHGTFEWLPGKAVALSQDCFPQIMSADLPVIYPFIVNNPGEAAQAKRRLGALTIGHMPPPMVDAQLTTAQLELEHLVDEYVQADGLDMQRQKRLAQLILEKAASANLDKDAGIAPGAADDEALKRIDTWLCDLKDFAIKDGQHIFGRIEAECTDPKRQRSARAERDNFLAALDGRFIPPGPAGSPSRGRTDIYPTGRNLFTVDPRMMPTPVACELGQAAAAEVLRLYLQDHGDWPRALMIDLWASASLRTGGEQIAQGLALLGCRPQWDKASGRVTGIEVLPPAAIGRPRIDVSWRISGLFRDMFPAQIALLSTAIAAIARRGDEDGDNPLAAAYQADGVMPHRIFGTAPGSYGSGIEPLLQSGDWQSRGELGAAYLAAGSHVFGGEQGMGEPAPGLFGAQIRKADLLLHNRDDSGHDLLEGSADVAYLGGFAAAVEAAGGAADLICLDTTTPDTPRARSLADELRRTVQARAINPRYICGQMRHGPRGASDFAETTDRLIGFCETTNAVGDDLIDALYGAYVDDDKVRAFLLYENPGAAKSIATRFLSALQRGLWHPRRNSTEDALQSLLSQARQLAPTQNSAKGERS